MKISINQIWYGLAGIVTVGAIVILAGYSLGRGASEDARERLQLLWPSFMNMPQEDKVPVVRAAMKCGLHLQPMQADAVARCLREGADKLRDDDVMAAERVDQLVAQVTSGAK